MKLMHPEMERALTFCEGEITSLVIENQEFFRKFIEDILWQIDGNDGEAILSIDHTPVAFSKHAALLSSFVPFDINQKALLSKITSALEKTAIDEGHYLASMELVRQIQSYFDDLFFEYPCELGVTKLSISSLIRSAGVEIRECYEHPIEKVLNYMELVREFDRDRLFIFVNMRSYFSDDTMEKFLSTVLSHDYRILLLDGWSHPLLSIELRYTVDADLCEF